ncbi:MAG: hypothetical protein C6I00_07350 [Nitratiruptor sp.]|nr:hypothetical protein [Nitratiruptor sp.]NPA83851.1 TonB-dependent receptor [Campylobacterota bacterium]
MGRLSLVTILLLTPLFSGETIQVEKIFIEERSSDTTAREVLGEEIKFTRQQDLAQILQELHPQINMVRASAIGNDLVLRGFKRDDINLLIDGAKIYGACPNRMDPPAMHISPGEIEKIQILEGPFDVEAFGSMGGEIRVLTKDPQVGFGGGIEAIYGSFDYKRFETWVSGGDETFGFRLGITHEGSDQYEDGNGRTLVEQNWAALGPKAPYAYQERYKDAKAYTRNTFNAKILWRPETNQRLRLSFMSDKATDVLYPAFQMDAQLDKTLFVNGTYTLDNLGSYSRSLEIQGYYSRVLHDMGTHFRNAALPQVMGGKLYRTHRVKSQIRGAKVKNSFEAGSILWALGVDGSWRNWNGICLSEPSKKPRQVRIPDVDTKNVGLFLEGVKEWNFWALKGGIRYDATWIEAQGLNHPTIAAIPAIQRTYQRRERTYYDVSGNLALEYRPSPEHKFFLALGQGIRVPDAQELYFIGFMQGNWSRRGNPDLEESKNRQVDLGYEGDWGWILVRGDLFYSLVEDYIYAYTTNQGNKDPKKFYLTWTNIDARLYGGELQAAIPLGEYMMAEGSLAYVRGKKAEPIPGQRDKDLAMIPPLRARGALSYDDGDLFWMVEWLGSGDYDRIDSDNGEQPLGSWSVWNFKVSKRLTSRATIAFGVDNIFDEAYALNNTYVGRALIGGEAPVLINEPGRFVYGNLTIRF